MGAQVFLPQHAGKSHLVQKLLSAHTDTTGPIVLHGPLNHRCKKTFLTLFILSTFFILKNVGEMGLGV